VHTKNNIAELIETFEFFDDWEDRYAHIIELGDALAPMDDALKSPATKVDGCMSQVWMYATRNDDGTLHLLADSDARIVRGLIAVLMIVYQGQSPAQIGSVDIDAIFAQLGLDTHLSMNRRNGFSAMVQRIRALAHPGEGDTA
jgi:cysteine desulfuration protein SufE